MKTAIAFLLLTTFCQIGFSQPLGWDTTELRLVADSVKRTPEVTGRVNLIGIGNTSVLIKDVHCSGVEAKEFKMVGNQVGYNPLEKFIMASADRLWVDVSFIPDYNKPLPFLFADRHATFEAVYYADAAYTKTDSASLDLIGTFTGTSSSVAQKTSSTIQAMVQGGNIIASFPNTVTGKTECGLYDLLGRKIVSWDNKEIVNSQLILPLPTLTSGVYFLRLGDKIVSLQIHL